MLPSFVRISLLCLAALPEFSGGCLSEVAHAADSSDESVEESWVDSTQRDDLQRVALETAFSSAGWIHAPASLVVPFCPAVLLASDTALTTSHCMEGLTAEGAAFGLDVPGLGPQWTVEKASAWRSDSPLMRLTLSTDVADPDFLPEIRGLSGGVYEVRMSAFAYVPANEVSWRWSWTGTLEVEGDKAVLSPNDDESMGNCHGDLGAGVYLASGELVGIVAGVRETAQCAELLDVELLQPDEGRT